MVVGAVPAAIVSTSALFWPEYDDDDDDGDDDYDAKSHSHTAPLLTDIVTVPSPGRSPCTVVTWENRCQSVGRHNMARGGILPSVS